MKNARPQKTGTSASGSLNRIPTRLQGKAVFDISWQWLDDLPLHNVLRRANPAPAGCRVMGILWKDGATATFTVPLGVSSAAIAADWRAGMAEQAYAFARATLERDWGKRKC